MVGDGAFLIKSSSEWVSKANVGLSTAGRFLLALVGVRSRKETTVGTESFFFCTWPLVGLPVISNPSNPSTIPQDFFFFGVVVPSCFLAFERPSSSLRS